MISAKIRLVLFLGCILVLHYFNLRVCLCEQVTPAQIREAEKSLLIMEAMIEAMTPGLFLFDLLKYSFSEDT